MCSTLPISTWMIAENRLLVLPSFRYIFWNEVFPMDSTWIVTLLPEMNRDELVQLGLGLV